MATPTPISTPTARRATPSRRSSHARPRGVARRIALLEATLELLAEIGADAVTHRRVAEHAGLPLASTTYWFESKEHLLTEALRYAAERDEARLRIAADALVASCEAGDRPPSPNEIVAVVLDPCAGDPSAPDSLRGRAGIAARGIRADARGRPPSGAAGALAALERRLPRRRGRAAASAPALAAPPTTPGS